MHMRRILCALILAGAVCAPTLALESRATTVKDRARVNLTVYNDGTTLLHDARRVTLLAGDSTLAWRDVSTNIDEASVILDTLHGSRVELLENNYNFDVLNPSALMAQYLGKMVVVVHDPIAPGAPEIKEPAKILSLTGGIVLQYRDRIETQVRGRIVYSLSIGNIRDRPTLDLKLSGRGGATELDLSYMTKGLVWHADYVGVLSRDESSMSLRALVTLTNTSGAAFENARLQLVAGNVNVAPPPAPAQLREIASVTSRAANAQQENFFDYSCCGLQTICSHSLMGSSTFLKRNRGSSKPTCRRSS